MKILFITALIIAAVTSLVHAQEELRLSPSDINALTSVNAGAGTSGVSGIQTRTLKGDATKSGIYTIQLTIPANVRIQAHTHPDDRVATVISGTWYIGYGAKLTMKVRAADRGQLLHRAAQCRTFREDR